MDSVNAILTDKRKGSGALLVMLSLNFLLLAFFILLNSMATLETNHAKDVLARVREGYNIQGPVLDRTGTAPWTPKDRWEQDLAEKIHGVVINRLQLDTVPLQVDGQRMVLRLPPGALFDGRGRLSKPEVVRNLTAAAGEDARVTWQVVGAMGDDARGPVQAVALLELVGRVGMVQGEPEVRVIFVPGDKTKPGAARTLQNLGLDAGGYGVEAEGHAKP